MKDHSMKLMKAAANAAPHPYGNHTGKMHSAGHTSKGRGTPPAPHNQGPNQPNAKKPATFKQGSKSPSQYGNAY